MVEKAHMTTSGLTRKGLNSLIILGAWIIRNNRIWCVFDGANPNMVENPNSGWRRVPTLEDGWSTRVVPLDGPLLGV
jgi:hypothetical protein